MQGGTREQPAGTGPVEDGRLARSRRTRLAIVEALRSLHQEGDLRPTAPRVAERAGVSLRTVWQHFEDLEELLVEAGRRDAEVVLTYVEPIDVGLGLPDRVDALLAQRARMYDAAAPTWRAARLQEPFSAQIKTNRDRLLLMGRRQLETLFAVELAAAADSRRLLDALLAVTGWSTWEALRTELKLGPDAARATLRLTLLALLGTT
jgi:AcrR family transcriptional regulator